MDKTHIVINVFFGNNMTVKKLIVNSKDIPNSILNSTYYRTNWKETRYFRVQACVNLYTFNKYVQLFGNQHYEKHEGKEGYICVIGNDFKYEFYVDNRKVLTIINEIIKISSAKPMKQYMTTGQYIKS